MAQIKAEYGSVVQFVLKERLCWGEGNLDDLKARGRPFEFDGMEGRYEEEQRETWLTGE